MDDEPSSQSLASFLVPVLTIGLVVLVQVNFWFASSPVETEDKIEIDEPQPPTLSSKQAEEKKTPVVGEFENDDKQHYDHMGEQSVQENATKTNVNDDSRTPTEDKVNDTVTTTEDNKEDIFERSNQWRCVCEEGSFLPPALLKTFGPAEAMVRLGTGQCYHKQM
ncbi:unnamed protein product [Cylindrotheca closterium]|uniref:Uncharacterized protein n=1 Tax=Cylindrotheca closterium TaxID=2856 RepID=A0AAD2CUU2_9STRA|nr:unnamed protein product [Cylindrotheca closterium]